VSVVHGRPRIPAPPWIASLFDPGLVDGASRLGWGFRNETWKVVLADGRRLAITRLADTEAAASIASLATLVQPRVRAAGVPTPAVIDLGSASTTGVLITEFVDGTPGAQLLEDDDGPAVVGSLLGAAWRRLAAIDPTGLPLPATWADPDNLAALSIARLTRAGRRLTRSERGRLSADIVAAANLLAGRQSGFVHGDLAPVNMVVRDRTLAALLDFEFVRLADPLLDAAWFDWIVAFHHPAEEPAAWRAFVASSGLDDREPASRDLLRILPAVRLLEILDDDRLTEERADRWLRMLRVCLARSSAADAPAHTGAREGQRAART
jgi:aminoglycoside phosphotransferase (APT) family kinase protein